MLGFRFGLQSGATQILGLPPTTKFLSKAFGIVLGCFAPGERPSWFDGCASSSLNLKPSRICAHLAAI